MVCYFIANSFFIDLYYNMCEVILFNVQCLDRKFEICLGCCQGYIFNQIIYSFPPYLNCFSLIFFGLFFKCIQNYSSSHFSPFLYFFVFRNINSAKSEFRRISFKYTLGTMQLLELDIIFLEQLVFSVKFSDLFFSLETHDKLF